ncbi:MAG: hypothetical protein LWX83_12830 [Anaerolineae bacterium]|nr:hypothetical protein [Anaerolineae bacterium]
MGILFLLIFELVVFLLFYKNQRFHSGPPGMRLSLIFAALIWGAMLVFITEGLSFFHKLDPASLVICWALLCGAGLIFLIYKYAEEKSFPFSFKNFHIHLKNTTRPENRLFSIITILWLGLIGILALTAWHYAPNNWDSMTYHLARIVHWQQEKSVAFFATHIDRQIQLQPGAEFILLHLQILSGGDSFANLLQWSALLFGGLNISWISKKFGADDKTQVFSAIFCWTLPMAILQASSTQNDIVVSAWLSAFVALGLELMENPRNLFYQVGCGLALGLAVLTKATAYVYALPFCIWIAFVLFKKLSFSAIKVGGLIALLAVSISLGHYCRNYQLYQSPLGPQSRYENEIHSPQAMLSNIIRNLGLHAAFSVDFTEPYDTLALRVVKKVHNLTGMDPVDPRTSFAAKSPFVLRSAPDEDYIGNPLHLFYIALTLVLMLWQAGRAIYTFRKQSFKIGIKTPVIYTFALIFSFLFFCIYLKWQIWNSRLHLPLFMLFAPIAAAFLLRNKQPFTPYLVLLLLLASVLPLFFNNSRPADPLNPLWQEPRSQQYFIRRPDLETPFRQITSDITGSGCHEVGLDFNEDTWEYPFWALLREKNYPVTFRHIRVANATSVLENAAFKPCAIIAEYKPYDYGEQYQAAFTSDQFDLYLSK